MASVKKLGRPTKERLAIMRNQASNLLWNGKLETTLEKAKSLRSYTEKVLTLAINSYEDTVKVVKEIVNDKGNKVKVEVINDGAKKLAARKAIMNKVYDLQEQRAEKESKANFEKRVNGIKHPLVEKIFNVYAPKYAKRNAELGQSGGYTRIVKLPNRKGDNAAMALIELVD